jgi:hypothetical protein
LILVSINSSKRLTGFCIGYPVRNVAACSAAEI